MRALITFSEFSELKQVVLLALVCEQKQTESKKQVLTRVLKAFDVSEFVKEMLKRDVLGFV
ncbi:MULTISPECIES: hypothetical protein [Cysteiniphilum]|uniref:Uncharacterized protein n=1 Tax=Cysteiniphilum litorale TaxID=2056700 RepID=A0A8J2Z5Q2_9GAMM|nr:MULTISPECIES: hypothetical protein [Cysteiniphilum]GGG03176.1 hypothetical protein GCM10010995_20780 [Cysteiniphilum litorale]